MKKKTLLLVFVHGFKGSDRTFHDFPRDLQHALASQLPGLDIVTLLFPQYETRGDLKDCVARFKEWLQNKVIDLEVANKTPSPTVDPSVHVVLCGHSMGGIVAAETLVSVVRDEVVPPMGGDMGSGSGGYANDTTNATTRRSSAADRKRPTKLDVPEPERGERSSSAPPEEHSRLFFPYIQAVLSFDTPYLGISPGVLAHGAEEQINHASSAYKAYDTASNFFGWGGSKGAATQANVSSAGALPAANGSAGGWGKWGKYAAFAGAAAGIAGAAGAAYLNWDQINQGLNWAGSHLEFVGCLARGAELQRRVESVVELQRSHGVGFANFYGVLGTKVTSQTKYAGAVLGADRTFCVVPNDSRSPDSPTGTKRDAPSQQNRPSKRRKAAAVNERDDRTEGEKIDAFAQDESKSKGRWIKCVNEKAGDELKAHTSMFSPTRNPDYESMVPKARDMILGWIGDEWAQDVEVETVGGEGQSSAGAEMEDRNEEELMDTGAEARA